jgi:hypothetical protein
MFGKNNLKTSEDIAKYHADLAKQVRIEEVGVRAATSEAYHAAAQKSSRKYDGEFIKTVEVPMFGTKDSWNEVNELCSQGYTVKAVVEREFWKTSIVVLEKIR